VTDISYVVELTGASKKLDAFIQAVPGGLITEVVRSPSPSRVTLRPHRSPAARRA
jgi:acetolactate synthase small subunit